jgi:hypothetical protein
VVSLGCRLPKITQETDIHLSKAAPLCKPIAREMNRNGASRLTHIVAFPSGGVRACLRGSWAPLHQNSTVATEICDHC